MDGSVCISAVSRSKPTNENSTQAQIVQTRRGVWAAEECYGAAAVEMSHSSARSGCQTPSPAMAVTEWSFAFTNHSHSWGRRGATVRLSSEIRPCKATCILVFVHHAILLSTLGEGCFHLACSVRDRRRHPGGCLGIGLMSTKLAMSVIPSLNPVHPSLGTNGRRNWSATRGETTKSLL